MGLEQLDSRRRCRHSPPPPPPPLQQHERRSSGSPPPVPTRYITSLRSRNRRAGSEVSLSASDPHTRLTRSLRAYYRDLAASQELTQLSCNGSLAMWAPPATLCPAYFRPALSAGRSPVNLCELLSAGRVVLVEGASGSGKTALSLGLLHSWATQNSWWGPTISVAVFVPLRELRGRSVCQYLCKELLPRAAAACCSPRSHWDSAGLRDSFSGLDDRLLFVLDGYDDADNYGGGDVHEVLSGRLFPDCRVVVTGSPGRTDRLATQHCVQRRVQLTGREWCQVERFLSVYFSRHGHQQDVRALLDIIRDNGDVLKPLAQAPLGWLCLCLLYEENTPEDFPKDLLRVHESLVQCLIRRKLVTSAVFITDKLVRHCDRMLSEFGRLALDRIKRSGGYSYSESEVRQGRRSRSAAIQIDGFGLLNRGPAFGAGAAPAVYTLVHPTFAEYLSARYIMTTAASDPARLKRELECLPGVGHTRHLCPSTTLILRFLMGMLGARAHLILDLLCPLDLSAGLVLMLLKSAGSHQRNVAAVCRLLAAPDAPDWPRVHTTAHELEGWTYVLLSGHCTLDRLELVYQPTDGLENAYLEMFFKALSFNGSVTMVRITSLVGQQECERTVDLSGYIATALAKSGLGCFELVITSLVDDASDGASAGRFQCIVDEICERLQNGAGGRAGQPDRLSLDLDLGSSQVAQLCNSLMLVSSLRLPHLCCDLDAAGSIARLMVAQRLTSFDMTGSWGTTDREDIPSSSGVSMGSGSSSCGGGLAAAVAARSTAAPPPPQLWSSALDHVHSASCACETAGRRSSFHRIFAAVRDPRCLLNHLNVSRCAFSAEDAACLGETVRRSRTLQSLHMEGFAKVAEVLPVLLALADGASRLQLLDLTSNKIVVDDGQLQLVCRSLAENTTLRMLRLDGWTYRLEENESLDMLVVCANATRLSDLVLDNSTLRLHAALFAPPSRGSWTRMTVSSVAVKCLRLAGVTVTTAAPITSAAAAAVLAAAIDGTPARGVPPTSVWRGPGLLPFFGGFVNVTHLDLSVDAATAASRHIRDGALVDFFSVVSRDMKQLTSLAINNWVLLIDDCKKTFYRMRKSLSACAVISVLKVQCLSVTHCASKTSVEHLFLRVAVRSLSGSLVGLDVSGVSLSPPQVEHLARTVAKATGGDGSGRLDVAVGNIAGESVKAFVSCIRSSGAGTRRALDVSYAGDLSGCVVQVRATKINNGQR